MPPQPVSPTSPARARLSLVLLLYFLGVIGVITLAPFRFSHPVKLDVLTTGGWFDVVANVLLFVPLGFLYPLTRSTRADPSPVRVFALGLVLSIAIETAQIFEHERFPSVVDVLTNAAGAAVGAMIVRAVSRRIRVNARLVGRLSLEIPLIGLIYLLVPLLVVVSFSAQANPLRLLALFPLGLVGARLISSVHQNHFGPAGLLNSRAMGLAAAAWTLVGTFPVWVRSPLAGAMLAVLVGVMTWLESSRPAPHAAPDRRFEAGALRKAAPLIGAYLLVMIVLPLSAGLGDWRFAIALTGGVDLDAQLVQLLEPVAALTVLGYLLAEARGRREQAFGALAARVTVECVAVAVAIEASRGFQPGVGASGIQLVLLAGAGLLGAGIYHNQREHVRWIVAHRSDS